MRELRRNKFSLPLFPSRFLLFFYLFLRQQHQQQRQQRQQQKEQQQQHSVSRTLGLGHISSFLLERPAHRPTRPAAAGAGGRSQDSWQFVVLVVVPSGDERGSCAAASSLTSCSFFQEEPDCFVPFYAAAATCFAVSGARARAHLFLLSFWYAHSTPTHPICSRRRRAIAGIKVSCNTAGSLRRGGAVRPRLL